MNLYENSEMIINPNFQRFFRWTEAQKSRFIESILLGIPTPAIFVYQRNDGVWELVDGLQRISTILEFVGKLKGLDGKAIPRLKLIGTKLLPSLDGITWDETDQDANPLPKPLQLDFKRSKIKVEIIQKESDANAKFEVFQRLNTGGTFLSEQEVRNCLLVMLNQTSFEWLEEISHFNEFEECLSLTDRAIAERYDMELALKYLALSRYELGGKDVSDYLTDSIDKLFVEQNVATDNERLRFKKLFTLLQKATGDSTFRKFSGQKFQGRFLDSAFEPIAIGLGHNLDAYNENDAGDIALVAEKIKALWVIPNFLDNVGSGSNAKIRIPRLVTLGRTHFSK
jgi:uncharacterized protein with ParB-like and HNH nuclease domain